MDSILKRLEELLRPFKMAEPPNADAFRNDETARRILQAWPYLPVSAHEPFTFGSVPEHKHNQWKYVWKFRKIEYREIEKATGIENRELLREKVESLINHQMIYPDGSLSRAAQALLGSR